MGSLDARFNKSDLVERIEPIGRLWWRINLYNLDASDVTKHVFPALT